MENTQSLDYLYYCAFFEFFGCEWDKYRKTFHCTCKLNQHICFKGILTSKFGPKDMLVWKRGSAFVYTEDENLWISSRLMWFYGIRPPGRSPWTLKKYFAQLKAGNSLERTMPKFPKWLFINVYLHLKGDML